ncbi:MAG: site-specific integrase [Lachnospiraceae bacterium]|nr:site-specific integrase [Lachnospiraceae bacterium]
MERKTEEKLTSEVLEGFLAHLLSRGRSQISLQEYRRTLNMLCGCLPEDKTVNGESGLRWRQWLEEQGFSPRTVNSRISVWNSLMQYLGHRDWQVDKFSRIEYDVQPELTRSEYLRLLSTAKQLGQERTYLLIKTLGGIGLRLQELPQLTAEAVREGVVRLERQNGMSARLLRLPAVLQRELMAYMRQEGITKGPVFTTAGGKPMDRTNVGHCIRRLSRDARVPAEKVNPRCLWKMYRSTQEGIEANITILIEQAYERLLEQEQLSVGWEYGAN